MIRRSTQFDKCESIVSLLGGTEFYAVINRRVQDRPRNRAKGHHKASKGQCFRLSLHRWLVKRPDSCEKVQEREGICIFCARMVSAALTSSKVHPLANDRIKSFQIFRSCPLTPSLLKQNFDVSFLPLLIIPRYQNAC